MQNTDVFTDKFNDLIPPFHFSISVRQSAAELLAKDPIATSWDITRAILSRHPEYGNGLARHLVEAKAEAMSQLTGQPIEQHFEKVAKILDPSVLPKDTSTGNEVLVDGRVFIRTLAHDDHDLERFLKKLNFLKPLEDELPYDFEAMLIPEEAGNNRYKGEFLRGLNNKAKFFGGEARRHGLVVLVSGGRQLEKIASLCQRQKWNKVVSLRYTITAGKSFADALGWLRSDLQQLVAGKEPATGKPQPSLPDGGKQWLEMLSPYAAGIGSLPEGGEKIGMAILDAIKKVGPDRLNVLETGQRAVLLFEFEDLDPAATRAQLGLTYELFDFLLVLPERLVVVFSGLPKSVQQEIESQFSGQNNLLRISMPPDAASLKPQSWMNDLPTADDQLYVAEEVNAIAEAIMLKEMKPPMVVGILGGWGTGKSSVMRIMERRIQDIRCKPIPANIDTWKDTERFPFIGHPYTIWFDAWTYAKGDLWGSLTNKIFTELDREMYLEHCLKEVLGLTATEGGEVWRALGRLSRAELQRLTEMKGGTSLKAALLEQGGDTRDREWLWQQLAKIQQQQVKAIATRENELAKEEEESEKLKQDIVSSLHSEVKKEAVQQGLQGVTDSLFKKYLETRAESGKDNFVDYKQLWEDLTFWKKILSVLRKGHYPLAWVLLGCTVILLLAAITVTGNNEKLFSMISSLGTAVTTVSLALKKHTQWFRKAYAAFEEPQTASLKKGRAKIDRLLAALEEPEPGLDVAELMKNLELFPADAESRIAEDLQDYVVKQQKITVQKQHLTVQRREIGLSATHTNLHEFLKDRASGKIYKEQLGILHQVQRDLTNLSDALIHPDNQQELFPRGQPRIILFIDDLDRCEPNKVVEVLEAAQLLVKTELFVVVLAIDVRYVTRALEKTYEGVLSRHGDPSGLDYIEKIIQIPYRIRPAGTPAVANFLAQQMNFKAEEGEGKGGFTGDETDLPGSGLGGGNETISPDAPKGPEGEVVIPQKSEQVREFRVLPNEALAFDKNEHLLLSRCCAIVGSSPRAMRRLVNIYKILKIIWYRQEENSGPEDKIKRLMLGLLAISTRYPDVMRSLLYNLESGYAKGQLEDQNIAQFMKELCLEGEKNALVPGTWKAVCELLDVEDIMPKSLSFADLSENNLRLVSTFSFVGDSDPYREIAMHQLQEAEPEAPIV